MMLGVTARVFVRSTEDPDKVMEAFRNVVPVASRDRLSIREHKGVYGNLFLSIVFEGNKKDAAITWDHIWKNMDPSDREFLKRHIEEFVDEHGHLHLRFSKRAAYEGRIEMVNSGVIKVVFKLEAYPAKYENFLRVAREMVKE